VLLPLLALLAGGVPDERARRREPEPDSTGSGRRRNGRGRENVRDRRRPSGEMALGALPGDRIPFCPDSLRHAGRASSMWITGGLCGLEATESGFPRWRSRRLTRGTMQFGVDKRWRTWDTYAHTTVPPLESVGCYRYLKGGPYPWMPGSGAGLCHHETAKTPVWSVRNLHRPGTRHEGRGSEEPPCGSLEPGVRPSSDSSGLARVEL